MLRVSCIPVSQAQSQEQTITSQSESQGHPKAAKTLGCLWGKGRDKKRDGVLRKLVGQRKVARKWDERKREKGTDNEEPKVWE